MSNAMRIPGLATGMDTDATIRQLMKPYNMKVDKMKQDKQIVQWKQEMMRDMIKELRGLKNDYLNIDSPDTTNMMRAGSFSVANITSSNEEILTATAMPGSSNVPSQVSVTQVAKPAKISAKLKLTDSAEVKNPISLSTTMNDLGLVGQEITFKYGIKDKDGKVEKEETFSIKVGEKDTLQDFINKCNSEKSKESGTILYDKAKITFSELTGSLNIETRNAGKDQSITLSDASVFSGGVTNVAGQNTIVNITPAGGTESVLKEYSNNEFAIDNIKYSVNPNAIIEKDKPITVSLTSKADAQKSVDKIKGFIDKYNAIVDKMYAKYSEKKQYKLNPLTDEQKKDMKEDEIKKWESKAKEGIIKGDEALGSMLNAMRNAIFTPVAGSGISLKEIGLDSYSGMEATTKPGQIKIVDTNKLKAALETRGDQVMQLFSATPDAKITDKEEISKNTGVFKRISNILNDYVVKYDGILLKKVGFEGTLSAAKNDLTEKMQKKDTAIYQMEKKMATQEERYYKKFAQLEKAMNALNSQSNWLTSQLGGGK